ncbi:MOSC domain-containing protein [Porcincola intestinalis]|uniref:MOSC domain-containing protein n=1 Tax=Porcincola intestinalis TaxID=2606632 RepID=UPI0023F10D6E|nr:MOSC domain-containing protein [Porcincola intestinalis]MCI6766826.1 molybdopterin-binding protein [Lachnospiraceae bacterium]MDD7059969.1 molybdopterin-binding protein [Porcincola intestinalis]MDY5282541.1 molybdopterin-binding protein [Porcincola intestinalis]
MEGTVKAVCTSSVKGVRKEPVKEACLIEDYGIEKDAHAGKWHRQVSLLSWEKVQEFNKSGAGVSDGDFGENLLVSGINFRSLPVGTRFLICPAEEVGHEAADNLTEETVHATGLKNGEAVGGALLELTQIGKACHHSCEIRKRVGVCIMPTDGVFAKVVRGGMVKPGDRVRVLPPDPDRPYTAAVITLSDRAFSGVYEDRSGPKAAEILKAAGYEVVETILLPDDQSRLERELGRLADQRQVSLVLTTGGTGFSERDRTPEATMAVADRNAPGIAEAIRVKSLAVTDHAMLSRGVSVIRKKTLIVNLPGSVKAVQESLGFILGALDHGLGILRGTADN